MDKFIKPGAARKATQNDSIFPSVVSISVAAKKYEEIQVNSWYQASICT